MNEFLSKFKDLGRGMPLRDVLTLEWVLAVQDCLRALAEGRNIQTGPGVKRHCNDGRVWLDAAPGGGTRAKVRQPPLTIVASRPAYIPEDSVDVAKGSKHFWITWGFVNNKLLDNWDHVLDVSLKGRSKYIFLKVELNAKHGEEMVKSAKWETWDTVDEKKDPVWAENGDRPGYFYVPLGMIEVKDEIATIHNGGGGSVQVGEHVSSINQDMTEGFSFRQAVHYIRLTY